MAQSVEPGPNLWAFVQQWWSLEPRFVGKVFDPTPFGIACHFCSKHRCGLLLFNLSCFGRIARVVSLVIGDGSSKSRLYFQSAQTELSCLERVTCQLGNYLSTARSLMAMHSGRIIDRPRAAIDICYNSSVAQSFCIQGHVLLDRIFAFRVLFLIGMWWRPLHVESSRWSSFRSVVQSNLTLSVRNAHMMIFVD